MKMVNLDASSYKKLSQRESVLARPQRFVGSLTTRERNSYLFKLKEFKMVQDDIEVSPAFERVFLEIMTNASDNVERSRRSGVDPGIIRVEVRKNYVSIYNEGMGIPTSVHPEFNVPTPQHLFSKFSCGSNFDDDSDNTGAGTFGIGASCTNTFSRKFIVEVGDEERGIHYTQLFKKNMSVIGEPTEKDFDGNTFVRITYILDFERFGLPRDYKYDGKTKAFLAMHCANMAFSCSVPVIFNDREMNFSKLEDYAKLYKNKEKVITYEDKYNRLVIIDKAYGFTSIVNNMCVEGGTHVDKWYDKIKRYIEKENKAIGMVKLSKTDLFENIIFLYSLKLNRVEYDNASKSKLMTPKKDIIIEEKGYTMLKGMEKWDMIKRILSRYKNASGFKSNQSGTNSRFVNINKLMDADDAGKARSKTQCDLVLCEGDSAKTAAAKGRTEKTKKVLGVMALKGKPINTTKHDLVKIGNNAEFKNIVKAMGFRLGDKRVDYTTEDGRKTLRYATITLFADPDPDGEHIKAICINMLNTIWPTFLKSGLLYHIIVPEFIARKGNGLERFYSRQEYLEWRDKTGAKGYKIDHIKGLATMTDEDIGYEIENPRRVQLTYDDDAAYWLKTAFDSKEADERKKWIHSYVDGMRFKYDESTISYFMTNKYILYAIDDWKRSLPRTDGLKVSQRKILYVARKKLKKSGKIRVEQLSGAVSEMTHYHHGGASLSAAITNMGRDNIGSNNIPLIKKSGQFGTRMGKDEGQPRYIFAQYNPIVDYIYRAEDDIVLDHLEEDGAKVEPDQFYPIVSMTHINSSRGIGTGYSIDIGCHHPEDIINHHLRWIEAKESGGLDDFILNFETPKPWYRGYDGKIIKRDSATAKNPWISVGEFERVDKNTIKVTELPVTITISAYLKKLDTDVENGLIKGFRDCSITNKGKSDTLPRIEINGATKVNADALHLKAYIPTSNIYMLTSLETCEKFTVNSLLHYFCEERYKIYVKRKEVYVEKLKQDIHTLTKKAEFITEVIEDTFIIRKRKNSDVIAEMEEKGYSEAFLKIAVGSQTKEGVAKIRKDIVKKQEEHDNYVNTTEYEIWRRELNELKDKLKKGKFI